MYEGMDAKKIGQKIRTMRKEKKLSVDALAKGIGTSASAVLMYEAGQRVPRDEIKIKIADFFERTVEGIFYR